MATENTDHKHVNATEEICKILYINKLHIIASFLTNNEWDVRDIHEEEDIVDHHWQLQTVIAWGDPDNTFEYNQLSKTFRLTDGEDNMIVIAETINPNTFQTYKVSIIEIDNKPYFMYYY